MATPPEHLDIGIVASARHPIAEPFAGGLEMQTHTLATRLRARGHRVTVYASATSDPELGVEPVCEEASLLDLSEAARQDPSMVAQRFLDEHHAYLHLMLRLGDRGHDVVQNNSVHYLPMAMAAAVPTPMVTTLHTPPTPWLESGLQSRPRKAGVFVSVSRSNARAWQGSVEVDRVVPNGIDLSRWRFGEHPDAGRAVWTGRIVPEKGTHLAVAAAHAAGLAIDVAGPVHDRAYFDERVAPLLRPADRFLGHLDHDRLAEVVRSSGVALITPCWDEPYGLVVAEALASGTPVAAFARGAIPEIVDETCGRLATSGDAAALGAAAREAVALDRRACRDRAERHCSDEVMVERYEALYRDVLAA